MASLLQSLLRRVLPVRNISGLLSSWPEGASNRAHQRRRKIRGARMAHTGESPVEKLIQETTGFDENGMYRKAVLDCMRQTGLQLEDDPRCSGMMKKLEAAKDVIDRATFMSAVSECPDLVENALRDDFVVQNFPSFIETIKEHFEDCQTETGGEVASYIPELARVDPNLWGVSLCTVSGQRYSVGDATAPFTIQSGGKCFNYAVVLEEFRVDEIHQYIGMEPSGSRFNKMVLNKEGKPHNPMINSGAMVICSLIQPRLPLHQRVNFMVEKYCEMAGLPNRSISCDMITCDSEMETAHRNMALLHYIKSKDVNETVHNSDQHVTVRNSLLQSFPPNTSLDDTMKFYTRLCAVEVDCSKGAVMAATLANGGVCPITDRKVLKTDSVKHTLTLMHSCGMYDFSGEFAFNVGLPAKSGVSGVIMAVIPGVMGLCMYSPPVNSNGNSVRGLRFCEQLVKSYNYHMYDKLKSYS